MIDSRFHRLLRVWLSAMSIALTSMMPQSCRVLQAQTQPPTESSVQGESSSSQSAGAKKTEDVQKIEGTTKSSLIIVVGAAGTKQFESEFLAAASRWEAMAKMRDMNLVVLGTDEPQRTDTKQDDKSRLASAIEELVKTSQPDQPVWLVMIGHGTSERGTTKFNLRGPDVSSKELSNWLKPLRSPTIVSICSSSSSPFLPELSAPGRIVLTATKSGSENNYSRFAKYLAATLGDAKADLDHDDEVSLFEAFLAASGETEKFYREESRLATEHAILDDNGDRLGTGSEFFRGTLPAKPAPAGKSIDGDVAKKMIVFSSPGVPRFSPEQLASRTQIEAKLSELRARKSSMPTEEYWASLEALLIELAQLYEAAQ